MDGEVGAVGALASGTDLEWFNTAHQAAETPAAKTRTSTQSFRDLAGGAGEALSERLVLIQ